MNVKNSKQEVFHTALLNYFNQVLLEKGLITKESYYAMNQKIAQRHK